MQMMPTSSQESRPAEDELQGLLAPDGGSRKS